MSSSSISQKQSWHVFLFCQTVDLFAAQTILRISLSSSYPKHSVTFTSISTQIPREKYWVQKKKKEIQNKATQTSEISVLWRSYSNVPMSPVLWQRPPIFEGGWIEMEAGAESISYICDTHTHTHTHTEYWSTEQQLGIWYMWWNCNVLRPTEIGFFLRHINKLFLRGSESNIDPLHPAVVKADL